MIDIAKSIQWQLHHITQEQVDAWCEFAEIDTMPVDMFREWWNDSTMEGLLSLLYVRGEWEPPEEGEEGDVFE